MRRTAPLTKMVLILLVSLWAMLLDSATALGLLTVVLLALFVLSRVPAGSYKALGSLGLFALGLAVMQYALGANAEFSLVVGLRMATMTGLFILLLATTRIQDLTASLVRQLHVPYEYAFMVTASLRFIPDLLSEIKAVQEAQACRGYSGRGSVARRLRNYLTIVQPLVLRSVARSETMAMSLELRGFGASRAGSYGTSIALGGRDYLTMATLAAGTALVVATRFFI
ncbi:MAG TPA: energy-coupling factor transporter transmembrane component T [Negativicutes bacterium]|nr:energy-coupling factor transporter transmembrane component T [Negativicutes bacterium]